MSTTDQAESKQGVAARRLAVEVLIKVEKENAFANIALADAFKRRKLSERDRAFTTALVQGVIRHRGAIDSQISQLSKKPLAKLPSTMRNILRLGILQLTQMPDIPPSAVLDTCCKLAKATGHAGHASFVNGLLRSYLRGEIPAAVEGRAGQGEILAVKYSLPVWLVERWLERWGEEEALCLLKWSQRVPPLVVRVCEQHVTAEALQRAFESAGMKCHRGRLVRSCLVIEDRGKTRGPVSKLPGYKDGLFVVQDEAAAFASLALGAQPGEVVVDLCAAPGGKSAHLAELMQNKGRVLAVDLHQSRLKLLAHTRRRLGLTNIEIVTADATRLRLETQADRILLDAPCTGTGVINRRSDLRLHREKRHLDALVAVQRSLLENAARLLKPGGTLLYSTCSIEPEENEENIVWFLKTHPHFSTVDLRPLIPSDLAQEWARSTASDLIRTDWIQFLPSRHALSGFFVCSLQG